MSESLDTDTFLCDFCWWFSKFFWF